MPCGADLADARAAEIGAVDGHDGGAFGAAVAFERADAEAFLEGRGKAVREFFRAGHHDAEAAEIARGAAAQVELQEGGRGEQEGNGVFAHERADGTGVERVGMEHHTGAEHGGQRKCAGEPERMEERQDAQDAVVAVERKDLRELLDVGADVAVRKHDALGLARAAAGKDDGRKAVQ